MVEMVEWANEEKSSYKEKIISSHNWWMKVLSWNPFSYLLCQRNVFLVSSATASNQNKCSFLLFKYEYETLRLMWKCLICQTSAVC